MISLNYGSPADLCAAWLACPLVPQIADNAAFYGIRRGIAGTNEALADTLRYGCPTLAGELSALLGKVQAHAATSARVQSVRADDGRVDVWQALRGDAQFCTRRKRVNGRAPQVLTITLDLILRWDSPASAVTSRATAVIIAADALTAAGYSVEIVAGIGSSTSKKSSASNIEAVVTLKRPDEPLNVQALAAVLHPAFLRAAIFAVLEDAGAPDGIPIYNLPDRDGMVISTSTAKHPHEKGDPDAIVAEASRIVEELTRKD